MSHGLKKEGKKIIWAIDPYADDKKIFQKAQSLLKSLVKDHPAKIIPVYALCSSEHNQFGSPVTPVWHEKFQIHATEQLKKVLSKLKVAGLEKGVILDNPGINTRSATQAVIQYAESQSADLIVCSTHGRTGLARFFMGSFVETLLMASSIPVITTSPHYESLRNLNKIFFPTDFSLESYEAFKKVVRFAAERKGRVVLFHRIANPIQSTVAAFGMSSNFPHFLEPPELKQLKKELEARADEWIDWAHTQSVKAEFLIKTNSRSVDQAIVDAAKKSKIQLIAMTSIDGPVSSLLLGSVTRQVIRRSECPVWVVHVEDQKGIDAQIDRASSRISESMEGTII